MVFFFFSPDYEMGRSNTKVVKLCTQVLGSAGGTGGQEEGRVALGRKQMNKLLPMWEICGLAALHVATPGPISASPPHSRSCEAIIFLERPRNTMGQSRD